MLPPVTRLEKTCECIVENLKLTTEEMKLLRKETTDQSIIEKRLLLTVLAEIFSNATRSNERKKINENHKSHSGKTKVMKGNRICIKRITSKLKIVNE